MKPIKGQLYRLFVERPTGGVGSKWSYGWEKYIPSTSSYTKSFTNQELFAGLGNDHFVCSLKTGQIVLFLEETPNWIKVIYGDQVCWIEKKNHIGYRIALCHPEQEVHDFWIMTQTGSITSWTCPAASVTDFLSTESDRDSHGHHPRKP